MSLDTRTLFLQHQILDLSVGGGTTISGVEAREIIEDIMAAALTEGDNISIVYSDVPTPGIITISTTASLSVTDIETSGSITFGTVISGTGDIYCDDLHTAGSTIYIGDYIELTDTGSVLGVNTPIDVGGSNPSIEFSSTSGTIGVSGMADLLVLNQDAVTINGDFIFDQNTISGTGAIYCNDLHTAGSSIYLGGLQLSYDGSKISIQTHIDTGQSVVLGTDAHVGDPGGVDNVILGYQAGYYCDGDYNVVLGKEAAYADNGSTAGDYGVFLGYRAGYSLQSGNYNVCIGGQAGLSLTNGSDNVCIGGLAGHQMTSTSYNVCIGNQAGRYNTGTGNVFLGSNAGRNNTGTNSIFIGNRAGYNVGAVDNVLYIAVSDTATPLIYGEFDNDLLRINGDTYFAGDVWYEDTFWDDLRVPGLQAELLGLRDPSLEKFKDNDAGSYGVYAYHFDPDSNEEVHFSVQLSHAWKEGTTIHPHIHWSPTTSGTDDVLWGLEYAWSNINDTFPTNTTVISVSTLASGIPYHHQIASFPTISGTGKTLSSMLMCRLFRWADHGSLDNYDADAALLEFDIHFEINSPGSRQEYIK